MLTIRQYNKIIHDWIVTLTGLNGSFVRPQKNKYGFQLTDNNGNPITFKSSVAMFYFGFEGDSMDKYYDEPNNANDLRVASVNITFMGDNADILASQMKALSLTAVSREYLANFGFAINGEPDEIMTDKEFASKWFYRRTLRFTLNCTLNFNLANNILDKYKEEYISEIPFNTNGISELAKYQHTDTKYDTSNATALPNQVLIGEIFYNADGEQVGTLNENLNIMQAIDLQNINYNGGYTMASDTDYANALQMFQYWANIIMNGGSV